VAVNSIGFAQKRVARPPRAQRHAADEGLIPEGAGHGRAGFWFYLIPGLVLLTVVILIPLVWNVYLSFTEWRGVGAPQWIGLDNWIQLAGDGEFWTSFGVSLALIVAMVVIPTLIGLVLAAMLFDVIGRKFGGKLASFLRATYYIPQLLPVVVASILVGWILRPQDGALNTILREIGLGSLQGNWLGSPSTALPSIMAVLVWVQLGYPVVIFMAALQRVDPELYEAAEIDGANWFQRFRSITVNIIRPEIYVVTLTSTIAALKVFGPVYTLTKGGPGTATLVPSYYSYTEFFQTDQVGYGAAISTALMLVIVVVAALFLRAQTRSERLDRES
jgi:raffinose/stachyose/melibiose transport system permease protein